MMSHEPTTNKQCAVRNTHLILASGSPRRQHFLRALGLPFEIIIADIDESPREGERPADLAYRLAQDKAQTVAARLSKSTEGEALRERVLILAADTVVGLGKRQLGKPTTGDEARAMLSDLRGRTHQVHTAISVLEWATGAQQTHVQSTDVLMRSYSDAEIEAYIATGDPMDKAGAYAIQHPLFQPVVWIGDELGGCFASVVGLPLAKLGEMLGEFGVGVKASLPPICEALGNFACCRRGGFAGQASSDAPSLIESSEGFVCVEEVTPQM